MRECWFSFLAILLAWTKERKEEDEEGDVVEALLWACTTRKVVVVVGMCAKERSLGPQRVAGVGNVLRYRVLLNFY